jgi:GntR family transcriptional regulator, transcriptional repressor for pyruvate dehydrogenase complex
VTVPQIDEPGADVPFYPISTARAHEEVVDQITFAIRSGLLRVGDRLPTIDSLAKLTGVSKPVVGEAIRLLRDNGILESKRGATGGVTVVSEDIPVTLIRLRAKWREAALAELVEARRPIEMELAIRAGQRATEDDFEAMADSVRRLESAVAEGEEPSMLRHLNHLFHYSFGRAAKSEMLAYYQHQILGRIAVLLHDYYVHDEDPELVIKTHWETLAAIQTGSEVEIRRAMDWHLANLEELVKSPELARWLEGTDSP